MEKGKAEEIIGYRVGDHFLCPSHYQMSVKILAVHEIELPAEAIKKGDIESLVCSRCENERNPRNLIQDLEREEKKRILAARYVIIDSIEKIERIRGDARRSINMMREIDVMRRKARFIKKTLRLAGEGRPLTRKNLLTLQDFFSNLGEKLDAIRGSITLDFFDGMDHRGLLAEQARGKFSTLPPEEQKVLRMRFGLSEKYAHEQERTGEETLPS